MEKEKIRLHCNGKDRYQENSHPEKFPPGIFQPMFLNIPTRVFNFFVFSLLWPPSLILLKRLFSNSIIHLFVLGDFIFEASHEEYDVKKFSQRNGAAWILSGELSSLTSPRPTTSPTPPFHLIVPVECRLMNLKII